MILRIKNLKGTPQITDIILHKGMSITAIRYEPTYFKVYMNGNHIETFAFKSKEDADIAMEQIDLYVSYDKQSNPEMFI